MLDDLLHIFVTIYRLNRSPAENSASDGIRRNMAEPYPDEEKSIGNNTPTPNSTEGWESTATAPKEPWTTRFVDSFKRDPNAHVTKPSQRAEGGGFDHAAAAERTANTGLQHKLKGRHMQMIAIGGSIGMSFVLERGRKPAARWMSSKKDFRDLA